jgi:membrane protease YdiL (CAAX protease family)
MRADRVALALCVAAFCLAMGLREIVNVWLGTGLAGGLSILVMQRLSRASLLERWNPAPRPAFLGVAAGVAMAAATWLLYPISIELVPSIALEVPKLYELLRQPPGPVLAFPVLVLVVTAEELVWRGLAIDVFSRHANAAGAVLLAALLYTLPQVAFRSPLLVVVAFACGAVWGLLRVRTNGLIAPLLAHLIWDLLVFVLFPVA